MAVNGSVTNGANNSGVPKCSGEARAVYKVRDSTYIRNVRLS